MSGKTGTVEENGTEIYTGTFLFGLSDLLIISKLVENGIVC